MSDRTLVYVVGKGDTLPEIADLFGPKITVNTIILANNLTGSRDIHTGDTLVIFGVKYIIVHGDTLKSIAKKYNADPDEIAQFNNFETTTPLEVGSTIIVPGAEPIKHVPAKPTKRGSTHKIGKEPYLGGSGADQPGYYSNPLPGGLITQGIHGWNAVDLSAARGTPIHAAADGTVIIARNNGGWNGGYGNYVVITHDNGSQTLYGHMKNTIVSPGQSVSAGQVIGYEGSTGESTGPHLHFEVRGAANPFRNNPVGTVGNPE
ncbi:MAG: peptidoglycan DD-metalloendopeptidase family protein [Candidatus Paceibacteria bacterium]